MRVLVAVLVGAVLAPSTAPAEPQPGVTPRPRARVAVVRQPGVETYESMIEEFRGQVLAGVRIIAAAPGQRAPLHAWLGSYRPGVVLAVGQSAYDLVRDGAVPVVSVLALRRRAGPGDAAVSITVPTTSVLAAFRTARPDIQRIGVLHGPAEAALVAAARAEAQLLGVELVCEQASSPFLAISALRRLSHAVQGLWLLPDLEILSPQVFQYSLMLQFRRHLPLLGATRRHALQGALFALDHDPADLGRQAAVLANQLLASEQPTPATLPDKLSLNLTTAQRIGVDSAALRRAADRVYQ
jgi:putative tryptophan/tyrosine transport system substrate-binding protein